MTKQANNTFNKICPARAFSANKSFLLRIGQVWFAAVLRVVRLQLSSNYSSISKVHEHHILDRSQMAKSI